MSKRREPKVIQPPPRRIGDWVFARARAHVEARVYIDGGLHLFTHKHDIVLQLMPGEKQTVCFGGMKITVERAASDISSFDELRRKKQIETEKKRIEELNEANRTT